MKNNELQWLEHVRLELVSLSERADAPGGDIAWLILRCEDTLRYPDHMQKASLKQLVADLADFEAEFPGLFSAILLQGP